MSEVCSAAGLIGLAFLPDMLPSPFTGIIVSVIIYAIGSGLIEVLCSPIVEACPFENKEATMSLLHSFYCWGSVGTILFSTAFFVIFGMDSWKWLAVILALIPTINIYNFAVCPIEHLVEGGGGFSVGIMWPGTISISSKAFPTGGTAMFALLAMAGDLGGSIGPGIVGRIAQNAGGSIRAGISIGLIFPVILLIMLFLFGRLKRND